MIYEENCKPKIINYLFSQLVLLNMGDVLTFVAPAVSKLINADDYVLMNQDQEVKINDNIDKDTFIIGSSWGRTGTSSLQKALQILGYPCYHMRVIVQNNDYHYFIKLGAQKMALKQSQIKNGDTTPWKNSIIQNYDWNKIFKDRGYHATVDEPTCAFYKELMEYYPNYKVIHNLRDPERWYDSAINTIMRLHLMNRERWLWRFVLGKLPNVYWDCCGDFVFDGQLRNKQKMIQRYKEWNQEVVNHVPKDRLLLLDLKQGWEPLCKFLGIKEIPDIPFPHVNEREIVANAMNIMNNIANIVDGCLIVGVIGVMYYYKDNEFVVYIKTGVIDKFNVLFLGR